MRKWIIVFISILSSFLFAGMVYADTWTKKTDDFGGNARIRSVSFSIGTKGYIGTGQDAGGICLKDFWAYDSDAGTWTQKANFGGEARGNAVGFSIGNKGYIGTGLGSNMAQPPNPLYYSDFWEYDPEGNTWTQKANFGGGARFNAAGFAIGSKGYVGTGASSVGGSVFNDFWEYDPVGDVWTEKTAFAGAVRMTATGFSIEDKGYLGMGVGAAVPPSLPTVYKDFYEYNPTGNTWTKKADFEGAARHCAVGFSIGTKGYIGTGMGAASGEPPLPSAYDDFWEYDPAGNTWTQKTVFGGGARYGATGFAIGTKGYVGTGSTVGLPMAISFKDFWEYSAGAVSAVLYGSFTGNGIWQWGGSSWAQLTPDNPEAMVAAGSNLYGKFSNGIWQWNGSGWTKLTPDRPASMVASGSNLYGNFTDNGIWQWGGSSWTQLTPDNPESMVAAGSNLYGKFGNGIWQWTGSSWTKLTPDRPAEMVAAGSNLYGSFTGSGIWQWNGSSWTQLTADIPEAMAAAGSNLYGKFGNGIWQWNGSGWTKLTPDKPASMAAAGSNLYGSFTGNGIWQWNGSGWTQLTPDNPAMMAVGE